MKNRKRFDTINVIPFIDIMLVLLVMVLTTATFVKQSIIPVDLPDDAKSAQNTKKLKELYISVDNAGAYYIGKERVSASELEKRLSTVPNEQVVVLRSDKEARFQDFVTVMDILKRLHHEQLYIETKR